MRLAALAVVVTAIAITGCDPASTPPSGSGVAAAAAVPVPAAAPAPAPSAADLDRALKARDERIRALDEALDAQAERLARLEGENRKLRDDLERAARTLEALRAASPLPNLAYDVPKIEGRVLGLMKSDLGPIVLLDVGRKQGVEPRFEFTVVRGEKAIAKVAIDRVDAEISSGRIVFAKEGEAIREGDVARTR